MQAQPPFPCDWGEFLRDCRDENAEASIGWAAGVKNPDAYFGAPEDAILRTLQEDFGFVPTVQPEPPMQTTCEEGTWPSFHDDCDTSPLYHAEQFDRMNNDENLTKELEAIISKDVVRNKVSPSKKSYARQALKEVTNSRTRPEELGSKNSLKDKNHSEPWTVDRGIENEVETMFAAMGAICPPVESLKGSGLKILPIPAGRGKVPVRIIKDGNEKRFSRGVKRMAELGKEIKENIETPYIQSKYPRNEFKSMASRERVLIKEKRFAEDLYTPTAVRGSGPDREGRCDLCDPPIWLKVKTSSYWYHMNFYHGISAHTGGPYEAPVGLRQYPYTQGNGHEVIVKEGKCGYCQCWVGYMNAPLDEDKFKMSKCNEQEWESPAWWRHLQKCQSASFGPAKRSKKISKCMKPNSAVASENLRNNMPKSNDGGNENCCQSLDPLLSLIEMHTAAETTMAPASGNGVTTAGSQNLVGDFRLDYADR